MIIGTLIVEALLYDPQSLKEKRSILKSITTRIRQRYNVSVVESNHQNVWQRTEWTIVAVSTDKVQAEKELQKSLSIIDEHESVEVSQIMWEWH
ncbi:DUF503 domain-containing protein [Bacillus shivajii]|uniref:DUF503 domain-containing protein n=1 Tax=Bacillus shivajii TaxID=1983719 RepID=UPI001CF98639|nr:DUF503 domain-containing protein [Bacillus shivajii]UCZ51683.1 DUF503 domain-containing protein [Bacillus shivajii]